YSSSSDAVDRGFFEEARELGKRIANENYSLIYGGAGIGLMGEVARSVHENGGRVTGVIPESLTRYNIAYEEADRLVVTETMRERKALMEDEADAFIALPGGFGTLEEVLEVLTSKQLQLHNKPIVLLNTGNFFRHLIDLFEQIYREKFAKPMHRQLYFIAADANEAVDYVRDYTPLEMPKKWF
ncbi:MAG: TIGR00730 family Rossman fold protein, partial [bacterium]|nr:TIGR00730 family Rossman fold protein [bacterium]